MKQRIYNPGTPRPPGGPQGCPSSPLPEVPSQDPPRAYRHSSYTDKSGPYCRLQHGGSRAGKIRPHRDYDVTGLGEQVPVQPEDFPEHPLDPVAADGSTDKAVHADSQPAGSQTVGQEDQGKTSPLQSTPFPVHLCKLPGFPEQVILGEPEPFHRVTRIDVFCLWPGGF